MRSHESPHTQPILDQAHASFNGADFNFSDIFIATPGHTLVRYVPFDTLGPEIAGKVFRDVSRHLHERVIDGSAMVNSASTSYSHRGFEANFHHLTDFLDGRPSTPARMANLLLSSMFSFVDGGDPGYSNYEAWEMIGMEAAAHLDRGLSIPPQTITELN